MDGSNDERSTVHSKHYVRWVVLADMRRRQTQAGGWRSGWGIGVVLVVGRRTYMYRYS